VPFLAPRFFRNPTAAWALSALTGALFVWPWGARAATLLAALAGLACALGQNLGGATAYDADEPSFRVPTARSVGRRAALAFAFLVLLALGGQALLSVAALGPSLGCRTLEILACDMPFAALWTYLLGLLVVAPFAREAHRLRRDDVEDGPHRLLMTTALVWSFALAPAAFAALHGDESSTALVAFGIALSWLAAAAVVARHVRAHRWLARVRAGEVEGFRLREVASVDERAKLRMLFSGYSRSGAVEALVRLVDAGDGAYRQGLVEEPVALAPAPGARPTLESPAMIAVILPLAHGLALLCFW
jgi:hypothetical protein